MVPALHEIAERGLVQRTASAKATEPSGVGTMLAAANDVGLDGVDVELSPKRARKARALRL